MNEHEIAVRAITLKYGYRCPVCYRYYSATQWYCHEHTSDCSHLLAMIRGTGGLQYAPK